MSGEIGEKERERERQQTDIYAPTYVGAYMQIANAHLT